MANDANLREHEIALYIRAHIASEWPDDLVAKLAWAIANLPRITAIAQVVEVGMDLDKHLELKRSEQN